MWLLSLLIILSSMFLASPFSPLGDRASLALARWSRGQASGLERREGREKREQWWPEERRRAEPSRGQKSLKLSNSMI